MSKRPTPQKPAKNKLFNLLDVVNFPQKVSSTLGVVLDSTGTYKTDDSFDYVTKIRIVDQSYNPRNKDSLTSEPYVMVFFYTKTAAEAPQVKRIGDIFLLKNFIFDTHFDGQKTIVKGKQNKSCSEWQLFDGRMSANSGTVGKSRTIPTTLFREENEQLKKLREWSHNFFSNNSILDLSWYQTELPLHIKNEDICEMKDIDLVLKVIGDVKIIANGLSYHKLVFTDEQKKLYFSEVQNSSFDFSIGDVVKVRSVCVFVHNESRKIDFFNYSTILQLQDKFKDAKKLEKKALENHFSQEVLESQFFEELHLEKYNCQQIGPSVYIFSSGLGKSNKKGRQNLIDQFPLLEQFNLKDIILPGQPKIKGSAIIGSVYHKEHIELPITPLEEIAQTLTSCQKSKTAFSKYKNKLFRVRTEIVSMVSDKFKDCAKIYSPSMNKTWNLDEWETAQIVAQDAKIIYYIEFRIKDDSLEDQNTEIPVYVVTFDGNPEKIFELWDLLPDHLYVPEWIKLSSAKTEKFNHHLRNLANPNVQYDLVMSVVRNDEGVTYFKIVDTIFWFQDFSKDA